MAAEPIVIHFELSGEDKADFTEALKSENQRREAPFTKNPFAKDLVLRSVRRRAK